MLIIKYFVTLVINVLDHCVRSFTCSRYTRLGIRFTTRYSDKHGEALGLITTLRYTHYIRYTQFKFTPYSRNHYVTSLSLANHARYVTR